MIVSDGKSVRVVTEFNCFSLEIIWEFDSFVYTFALLSFTFFFFFDTLSSPEKISYIVYILDRKKGVFYFRKKKKKKKNNHTLDIVERNKNKGIRSREIGSSLEGIIRLATGQLVPGTLLLADVFISCPTMERTAWNN